MSTQINVTVDSGGLLERSRQQVAANRQAHVEKELRAKAEEAGQEQRAERLAEEGRDAQGRLTLGGLPAVDRYVPEPAAQRRGGPHVLFIAPSTAPTTEGSYTLPDLWSEQFPTGNPPRRWWNVTTQKGFKPRLAFLEPPNGDDDFSVPNSIVDGYVTFDAEEQCFRANNSLIADQVDTQINGKALTHYSIAGTGKDSIRALRTIVIETEVYMPSIPNVIYNINSTRTTAQARLFSTDESSLGSLTISVEAFGNIAIPNTGPNAGIDQGGYTYKVLLKDQSQTFTVASADFIPDQWAPIKVTINGGNLWQDQTATDWSVIFEVQGSSQTLGLDTPGIGIVKRLFVNTDHYFVIAGSILQTKPNSNPYSPIPEDWKMRNVRYTFR